jgi:ABC-2 type transport system ATP-binding protein
MDHGLIVAEGSPRELKRQVSGDRIVLSLRNDGRGADGALLAVRSLRFVREAAAHGDQVRLYVDDGTSALPELVRFLEGEGCRVSAVSLSEPTLDDVFLAKTGRSLRDVEPTGEEAV